MIPIVAKESHANIGDRISDARWSPCGNYIACKSLNGSIFLMDFRTRVISCIGSSYRGTIFANNVDIDYYLQIRG